MTNDFGNVPEERAKPPFPATITLLVINGLVFLGQLGAAKYYPAFPLDDYFALSLNGLRHGFIWQLLTFQFMHGGFWHIALNCWAIYVFGRAVEITVGKKRMLQIYLLSGVVGGLVQMLGTWLLPGLFGDAGVVGASAGAFGLVASFAVLYPTQKLFLLLFFILPLKLKATTLLWLCVALSLFGILFPLFADRLPASFSMNIYGVLGGNVAHAAHLGGIIAGFWFTKYLIRKYRERPAVGAINSSPKSSLEITPAQD